MIKPGQFKIKPGSIDCTYCNKGLKRVESSTDETWGDGVQYFIDTHTKTCEEGASG